MSILAIGAGYVKAVGSKVTKNLEIGDPVLLSFDHCESCTQCKTGHPAYCNKFTLLNGLGDVAAFKGANGDSISGQFFGQSSFANLTTVKTSSIVNMKGLVKNDEELKLFAPLGCGFQTGAGVIVNLTASKAEDSIVVLGLGGVGLSAIMVSQESRLEHSRLWKSGLTSELGCENDRM